MIKEKHIISALPLLAAVLGRKYGVRVEIGGESAYTDGKTVHLPSLPAYGDATLLGLVKGYADHESAHIRETDFALLERQSLTPLEKCIWNIIEDYRVEHKLAAVFPGCRHNFNWLIKHLFIDEYDSTQTVATEQQILNWLLLKIRSWDVAKLSVQVQTTADEVETAFPGLIAKITAIVNTIPGQCHSTQNSLDIARELVQLLKEYSADLQEQREEESGSQQADNNNQPVSGEQQLDSQQLLHKLLNADASDLPQDMGKVMVDALGKIQAAADSNKITIAQVSQKATWELTEKQVQSVRQATIALRTRLLGLLQSKVFKPSRPGYQGRLDTHNLHRMAISNPKVFRQKELRQGLDTAVHILLDTSGSMHGRSIELASQACFVTAQALSLIPGINLAVTAFPGDELHTPSGYTEDTVAPILKANQQMHRAFAVGASGNTPMDSALWWVNVQMQLQSQKRKTVLLITDGEPNYESTTKLAIAAAMGQGIELYGIGINTDSIFTLLPASSLVINSISELPNAMFSLLQNALLKSTN